MADNIYDLMDDTGTWVLIVMMLLKRLGVDELLLHRDDIKSFSKNNTDKILYAALEDTGLHLRVETLLRGERVPTLKLVDKNG